jgi:hypothetical protein
MMSSSAHHIHILPRPPLPVDLAAAPNANGIPAAYVPVPKFGLGRGRRARKPGEPRRKYKPSIFKRFVEAVLPKPPIHDNHHCKLPLNSSLTALSTGGLPPAAPHQEGLQMPACWGPLEEGGDDSFPLAHRGQLYKPPDPPGLSNKLSLVSPTLTLPITEGGEPVDEGPALEAAIEEVEALIPLENGMLRRKAAKRTLPWELAAGELDLVSPPPQAEDVQATKKPRLEEPCSASTDETTANTAPADGAVAVRLPAAAADSDQLDADSVKDTRATGHWAPEEDAKLKCAVIANPCKKKYGKEYRTDWAAVAALFSGRTKLQCRNRWRYALHPNIDRASGHTGRWIEGEDSKLKDWGAISAIVPGRTEKQCRSRWHNTLNPSIDHASGGKGKWTEDEHSKLKDAVQTHGGKNWAAIAALVSGRTKTQCHNRWHQVLDTGIDRANKRNGKWADAEDLKLKDAVQTHGGKNWDAIAALVPGRTKRQCQSRWEYLRRSLKQE